MAWTYDLVAAFVSVGRWKAWVYSVLPYLNEKPVLEIGHGPGHLQSILSGRGVQAIGIDVSHRMGLIARQRLRRKAAGESDHASPPLITGCAQALPFPGCSFEQIVTTFPTEYIVDPRTLEETYRVLSPGGRLVILPVAWITGGAWYDRLATWLFKITGQAPEWQEQFTQPFKQAGFIVQIIQHEIRSSKVLIILASKPLIV